MEKLLRYCQEKNLKLNRDKLVISTEVEFGGNVISSQSVSQEEVIFIDPKNKRIKAFTEMKKPQTKK